MPTETISSSTITIPVIARPRASRMPVITAGSAPGSRMRRQISVSDAPKLRAISIRAGSTCLTPARLLTITIGIANTTTRTTLDGRPSAISRIGIRAAIGVTTRMLM